jgi:hypothetical protein
VHCLINIQCPEVFARKAGKKRIGIHNRPEDLEWVEQKVCWLFEWAGGSRPPIIVE